MNSQMFSVLSEQNRLDIIELLYKHPHTVTEIVDRLRLNQPQVSKHLKVLAESGVVKVQPIKNTRLYALRPQPFLEMDTWLKKYRTMWEDRFDRLDTLLQSKRGGGKK